MMAYLDTNVIVSYCFKDENHAKAAKVIEELAAKARRAGEIAAKVFKPLGVATG